MNWTVIRASLQQRRTSLMWYSIGLAVYSWFIVWYYPQFAGNDEFFEQIQQVMSGDMLAAFGAADLNFGTLGGFLGRKGDGEPGTQTLWLGLQRLDDIVAMWLAMTSLPTATQRPVSSADDSG